MRKVVLVTGAASGIGKAVAESLSRQGAEVVMTDLDQNPGAAIARQIGATFLQADLSHRDAVNRLAEEALAVRGRIDILVNNAGLQHLAPIEEFSEDRWALMIQVMLIAPFQLIKAVVPGMKQSRWGRILNMSSIHGMVASPYKSAYVAAKHGVIGLTKTVALELGSAGITVNAICPAYVRTPLVERQVKEMSGREHLSEEEVLERIMLEPAAIKRLIEPEEVAELAGFLVSDHAGSMTGSAYMMDLGWTAR